MPKFAKNPSPQRGTNPPTRDVNAAQRVSMALKLRASKATYESIAKQCGYATASACRKAILRELDRTVVRNVEHLRMEELHTLDTLQTECFKRLMDKDYSKSMLFAVDRIVAIMERRAKLLGLDTPVDTAMNANMVVIRETPPNYLALDEVKNA